MIRDKHELAGKTVVLKTTSTSDPDVQNGAEFRVEDYWQNVSGKSWMDSDGNPAAMKFAMRSGLDHLPWDNEVVYGKIGPFGHLVHVSELGEVK